jgi:hypothetical protein
VRLSKRCVHCRFQLKTCCRSLNVTGIYSLHLQTQWVVETDQECKELVQSAGGKTYGFDNGSASTAHWASVTGRLAACYRDTNVQLLLILLVNVNINGTPGAGFGWGFLSTRPHHIRIFKGPAKTCSEHPWDAMILRDCTSITHSLCDVGSIASRKWDILCMKMCEDYDRECSSGSWLTFCG